MSIIQLALTFFIVTNPIGNCPTIISLIKDYPIRSQQKILFRESMFGLLLAVFFLFLGKTFLDLLHIERYALTISGGIILFIVALHMIFANRSETQAAAPKTEPFIVPIATPLLSGAGLLAMIMLYANEESQRFTVFFAILLAWVGITSVLVAAPYLQILVGRRGLLALEQLMGMLLAMIATEMIVNGTSLFLTVLAAT